MKASEALSSEKTISAEEFDRRFDDGEDISEYLDWDNATRPNLETQRINVDFPKWMVTALDCEARRLSIPRQAVIKMWIDERLKAANRSR
ncbi:MAG TPA: CopG family antitoxin [Rhodothermales bacterium]|nr:CopG family antitoxin [Rhodothermales bacterium]